jgi:hypothetical protein
METVEDIAKDNPTVAFCEIAPPRLWVTRKLLGSAEKPRWTPVLHKPWNRFGDESRKSDALRQEFRGEYLNLGGTRGGTKLLAILSGHVCRVPGFTCTSGYFILPLYRSKISVTILIQISEKYEILFQRIARARGAPRGGEFV